jgi:hypothetical protein
LEEAQNCDYVRIEGQSPVMEKDSTGRYFWRNRGSGSDEVTVKSSWRWLLLQSLAAVQVWKSESSDQCCGVENSDTDPDPAFQVNPDPDTDPGFWWPEIEEEKNTNENFVKSFFLLKKFAIYLSLGLHKGRQSYRRNPQASKKKTSSISKDEVFKCILFFWPIFSLLDPDPGTPLIQIQFASTTLQAIDTLTCVPVPTLSAVFFRTVLWLEEPGVMFVLYRYRTWQSYGVGFLRPDTYSGFSKYGPSSCRSFYDKKKKNY